MDELFAELARRARWYSVEVRLSVTAGLGDMTAAEFLQSLETVGTRLDAAGVPLAFMATSVTVEVIVPATAPLAALAGAIDVVEEAVEGRRLKVEGARLLGLAPDPEQVATPTVVLTSG